MRLCTSLLGAAAAVIVLLGLELFLTASVAQAQSQNFEYTTRIRPWQLDNAKLAKAFDTIQAAGVSTVDVEVPWAYVDQGDRGKAQRTYDWYQPDRVVKAAEDRGMKVTFLLTQTPDWVHPDLENTVSSKVARVWTPPRGSTELQHWSNFVRDVASRYKGQVMHYEMWNEPNHKSFWRHDSTPDAAEYVPLLRAAYLAAKETDPQATVVSGGLSTNDLGYLRKYYETAKTYSDASSNRYFFDVLGLHPYSYNRSPDYTKAADWDPRASKAVPEGCNNKPELESCQDQNFLGFERMKRLMEGQGDEGKNLFLSEYGHPTSSSFGNPGTPDDRRALYLKRAYEGAKNISYVEGMSWYAYHPTQGDPAAWTLVDADFDPSLSFRAYKQTTGAETSNVKVAITIPTTVSGTYLIKPQVDNLPASSISRWELYVDGALVGEQATSPLELDTSRVGTGTHKVMVAAYTTEGSVWHSNIAEFTPTISTVKPANEATGVERSTNGMATFSEEMDQTTLTGSNVKLYQKYWYKVRKKKGKKIRRVWTYRWVPVSAEVSYDAASRTVTLDPYGTSSTLLAPNSIHLVAISTGVKDEAGNALSQSYSWTFTTGSN